MARNVCSYHSNARRYERALRPYVRRELPSSVRLMCSLAMCQSDDVNPLDPLTWREACVYGKCKNCPDYSTEILDGCGDVEVVVALWGKKYSQIKRKEIVNLHNYSYTVQDLAAEFDSKLARLKTHCFTASKQWAACHDTTSYLNTDVVATIEDYQMNLEVIYYKLKIFKSLL